MGIFHKVYLFFLNIYIIPWDLILVLANLVLPKRPIGKVVPQGQPGADGNWPEYVPRGGRGQSVLLPCAKCDG